jgi:hypothetical protein
MHIKVKAHGIQKIRHAERLIDKKHANFYHYYEKLSVLVSALFGSSFVYINHKQNCAFLQNWIYITSILVYTYIIKSSEI